MVYLRKLNNIMNKEYIKQLSEKYLKEFGYSTFNKGQQEAIIFAVESILSGKIHTILEIPTGGGKSFIAICIHKIIRELKNNSYNSVILTTTNGLQKQYTDEFSELLELKGKNNYPCLKNTKGYSSPDCVKELANKTCSKYQCPYIIARDSWILYQNIKITNSTFFIKSPEAIVSTDETKKLNLCIIDECHEIDKVIVENTSLVFDFQQYKNITSSLNSFVDSFSKLLDILKKLPNASAFCLSKISDSDNQFIKSFKDELQILKESTENKIEFVGNTVSVQTIVKYQMTVSECKELIKLLSIISHDFYKKDIFEWVLLFDEFKSVYTIKPISSNTPMTKMVLFDKAKQFIHMSATIGGIEQYTKNLGITDYVYFEIDHPIPVKNRKIFTDNTLHINYQTDPKIIVKTIDGIIKNELVNGNGVIHTVSFKLAQDIKKYSAYSKYMMVSNNRAEILDKLSKSKNTIILSPSIETGYDFKGDLARWQIIAKMPFLSLGDIYVTERKRKSNKWYVRETVLRLIQASGRIVRGISDYGNTYIIDKNFFNIVQNNVELFPDWYLESIE